MNPTQLISIAVPASSIGIALVAILVCLLLFLASSRIRQDTREAAKTITTSVERLEKLIDKIFNETFAVMRDVVSYSLAPPNSKSNPKDLEQPDPDPKAAATTMASLEGQLKELRQALNQLAERQQAIAEMIQPEAEVERHRHQPSHYQQQGDRRAGEVATASKIRVDLLQCLANLNRHRNPLRASDVLDALKEHGHDPPQVVQELESLEREGVISLSDELPMGSNTIIKVNA